MLIAARTSEYKDEVVELVCEELEQDDAHVLAAGVGALADHNAKDCEPATCPGHRASRKPTALSL